MLGLGPIGPGLLAGDLVVVTIVAHWSQGFWAGGAKVGWEFPVPLAVGALAIALAGNGAWSLDRMLALAYPDWLLPAWLVLMAAALFWPWVFARCKRQRRHSLRPPEPIS